MKKYVLLVVCLTALSVGATDIKYKNLMKNAEPTVNLNGITFVAKPEAFVDFEKDAVGLGWTANYFSDPQNHCLASLYIYDKNPMEFQFNEQTGKVDVNSDERGRAKIDWENIPVETWRAYNDIAYMNRDLTPKPPEMEKALEDALRVHVKKLEKQKKLGKEAKAPVSVLTGRAAGKTMGVGVTVHQGNFLKVRMTCSGNVSEQKMTKAIADGAKWLRGQVTKPAEKK
ncbi:MAG: hypothetical protein IKS41_03970 [Alphaproteobacteria bacterium]|nr:hypothetical protein [Alphaproteobacteria bacterium]